MFESLPRHIINYLLEKLPPYARLLVLHSDVAGNLLAWYGPWEFYFDIPPQRGNKLSQIIPFLEGVFPLPEKTIEMPKLQLNENKWVDINILKDTDESQWIFISDCTKETLELESLLQRVNEKQLKTESKHNELLNNPFGQVQLFQVATFEKYSKTLYRLCGEPPAWLNVLKPEIIKRFTAIQLSEYFPFLEIFDAELADLLKTNNRSFYNSGIWIESDAEGKEYFLRAFMTLIDNKKYLLIRMLNEDLLGEQDTIQKAREQQLAFEHLAKAKKKLQELLDYKDKFVSIITHDLRSPIASVLGATEMLINDKELIDQIDEFNKEILIAMREEMNRMLDYNDKLYHWSNLELGNFELEPETIAISELLAIVEKTFQNKFIEKGIQFLSSYDENGPLKVDITLFLQVLNNLVGNALKFTPEGGNIQISYQQNESGRHLVISDSGTGMPEEKAAHLFDRSSQESSLGTKGEKGSGLGLGIVKRIIDAHHFSIHATSKPGKGTQMIIDM